MSADVYDITIIGAGPTGLFAAFYAGMRGLRTKIIESLPEVGGQLAVLYPEKLIYDVPGFPKVLAKDLVRQLEIQGFHFEPTICLRRACRRSSPGAKRMTGQRSGPLPLIKASTSRARWSSPPASAPSAPTGWTYPASTTSRATASTTSSRTRSRCAASASSSSAAATLPSTGVSTSRTGPSPSCSSTGATSSAPTRPASPSFT